jgi:hypothetical protein
LIRAPAPLTIRMGASSLRISAIRAERRAGVGFSRADPSGSACPAPGPAPPFRSSHAPAGHVRGRLLAVTATAMLPAPVVMSLPGHAPLGDRIHKGHLLARPVDRPALDPERFPPPRALGAPSPAPPVDRTSRWTTSDQARQTRKMLVIPNPGTTVLNRRQFLNRCRKPSDA